MGSQKPALTGPSSKYLLIFHELGIDGAGIRCVDMESGHSDVYVFSHVLTKSNT